MANEQQSLSKYYIVIQRVCTCEYKKRTPTQHDAKAPKMKRESCRFVFPSDVDAANASVATPACDDQKIIENGIPPLCDDVPLN